MTDKVCKDCLAEGRPSRPVLDGVPGPRCWTHNRVERKRIKEAAHGRRITTVYAITPEQYAELYQVQGGRCAICQWATGRTKRLAVDHDHDTGEVRGLLCGPCNLMIGRLRTGGMVRALEYLHSPPARKVLVVGPLWAAMEAGDE